MMTIIYVYTDAFFSINCFKFQIYPISPRNIVLCIQWIKTFPWTLACTAFNACPACLIYIRYIELINNNNWINNLINIRITNTKLEFIYVFNLHFKMILDIVKY